MVFTSLIHRLAGLESGGKLYFIFRVWTKERAEAYIYQIILIRKTNSIADRSTCDAHKARNGKAAKAACHVAVGIVFVGGRRCQQVKIEFRGRISGSQQLSDHVIRGDRRC
jgi:hypothetical protein